MDLGVPNEAGAYGNIGRAALKCLLIGKHIKKKVETFGMVSNFYSITLGD